MFFHKKLKQNLERVYHSVIFFEIIELNVEGLGRIGQ